MAGISGQEPAVHPNRIPTDGFVQPRGEDQPSLISAVGFIVLGFGFMAAFTALGLLLGAGVVSAIVTAWISSIAAILLVAALVVWREAAALSDAGPGLETILEWEDDLKAELRQAQQVLVWDYDKVIDAVEVDDTEPEKRRA
jgi:hypothetical protein